MGMVRTLGLLAVVIFALQERPGRRSLGGLSRVTTTLKSLASSVPVVDCEVATPVVRRRAWSPTSVTWPLRMRPGKASMVTSAGWPSLTLTMSVSSTLTSAVMTLMSARVIRVDPSAFWMPTTTVSPSRTGTLVTRPLKGARLSVRPSW